MGSPLIEPIESIELIEAYRNRDAAFSYRGRDFTFSLSHGLFSSAGVDTGSRLLLKVFSNFLDSRQGGFFESSPFTVLDAGSGAGVLGICAAHALRAFLPPDAIRVRAQDRDELARLFTGYNAARNGLPGETLISRTEALLSGPPPWNLILANIPAKAGLPVLEDFVRRSATLLKKNGLVFLVAVNTLAEFFRSRIAGGSLVSEERGGEHTVFVYGGSASPADAIVLDEKFPSSCPFYIRNKDEYEMENIRYRLDTVHGAPDFDSPGGAAEAAAKLALKIDLAAKLAGPGPALVHDAGQGHFALWLARYLQASGPRRWVLSGRNVLALAAGRAAFAANGVSGIATAIPAVDILQGYERVKAAAQNSFALIAFFPETVPGTGRWEAAWEGLASLAAAGCTVITGMSSSESELLDRKKPPAFQRLGGIRRKGFRALAYVYG